MHIGYIIIYLNGTIVEFYSSSNPGPLGKPETRKISGNIACRDWDPTDFNNNNPWHSYSEPVISNDVVIASNPEETKPQITEQSKEEQSEQPETPNTPVPDEQPIEQPEEQPEIPSSPDTSQDDNQNEDNEIGSSEDMP